jgi:hypothetical protein
LYHFDIFCANLWALDYNTNMKLFRYRRPSVNTLLGITKAKRRFRKVTGLSTIARYTNSSRIKQRIKYKSGLYSPEVRVVRQTSKGKFPSFLGLFGKKEK